MGGAAPRAVEPFSPDRTRCARMKSTRPRRGRRLPPHTHKTIRCLESAIEAQRKENESLRQRNRALEVEVNDLKTGLDAIEERARSELGMIREVEIQEKSASIRMILTTPFCPYGLMLLENARLKAEKSFHLPVVMQLEEEAWDPSMIETDTNTD